MVYAVNGCSDRHSRIAINLLSLLNLYLYDTASPALTWNFAAIASIAVWINPLYHPCCSRGENFAC
ncbi:hypothetical protein NG791_01000 [Laspinema sp. D1]|uniref:hypothetical protein n=1 Tax=Laspinema palackyanum TaxID=3231601 RepID=UPI00346D16A4|nr:hypothetical protein [Laspinema sp. D2b]